MATSALGWTGGSRISCWTPTVRGFVRRALAPLPRCALRWSNRSQPVPGYSGGPSSPGDPLRSSCQLAFGFRQTRRDDDAPPGPGAMNRGPSADYGPRRAASLRVAQPAADHLGPPGRRTPGWRSPLRKAGLLYLVASRRGPTAGPVRVGTCSPCGHPLAPLASSTARPAPQAHRWPSLPPTSGWPAPSPPPGPTFA